MLDEFIPTLSHATERDIDLILVEEIYCSLDFTTWISALAGISSPIASWEVKHSKRRTRSRREIDIFIDISHSDTSRSAILIENKLDAGEQPDQAESYREELAKLEGNYKNRSMLITCPEAYAQRHPCFTGKFDNVLSYETISRFFREMISETGSELVLRYRFRADILDQAIHKHRRGYTPIPDKVVGDFNARYVKLLTDLAPEIIPGPSMRKPANPRESTSMIFDPAASFPNLPEVIRPRRFAHELGRGSVQRANYVAVTFAGWGAALPHVLPQLNADASSLGATFTAEKPTKNRPNPGLKMLLLTEPIDNQRDFDEQAEPLTAGIRSAQKLLHWLLSHHEILHSWNALIQARPQAH